MLFVACLVTLRNYGVFQVPRSSVFGDGVVPAVVLFYTLMFPLVGRSCANIYFLRFLVSRGAKQGQKTIEIASRRDGFRWEKCPFPIQKIFFLFYVLAPRVPWK